MTPSKHDQGPAPKDDNRRPRIGFRGWKEVGVRVKDQVGDDHISVIAAGVAFYALLAFAPALAAVVSIWGLFADPAAVSQQVEQAGQILPAAAQGVLGDQLTRIAGSSSGALGLGVVFGILVSLWSANKGMKAMIEAVNIAYDDEEGRGFFRKNAVSLGMTVIGALVAIVAIGLVVALPPVLGLVGLESWAELLVSIARWPLLIALVIVALGVVYRYASRRPRPDWRWVSPGAVAATLLWLLASLAFSYYVANFGSYNETYGSLGAVVILLFWFYLTAFTILLGAELNAELSRVRKRHAGEPAPRRDTYAGTPVGEAH